MTRLRALAILVMLVAEGCTSTGEGAGRETVTFQIEGELEENAVYADLVRSFERENPGVDIDIIEVSEQEDALAKLTTSFAAGDPPDIFLINYREYSQFVNQGAIEPVGDHVEEAGFQLDDYFSEPLEAFTFDGELQCMPQNISSLVVYYNSQLFDDAGMAAPSPGWTFDQFRATARALTSGTVKGLGIEPRLIRVAPFVWSNGGEIVDDSEAPTRFTLDHPASREALQLVIDLVREDGVVPSESEVAAEDLESRFVGDKLGMFLGSRRDTPKFREIIGLQWDVAPIPVLKQPAGILHSDAYCISRGSDRFDAGLAFVRYALGPEGQTISAFSGRTVPSLRRVAESGAFLDPSKPPAHARVFLDGIPHIRRTPVIPTWPEIEERADEIFTRLFYEPGYTIDDGLRELEQETRDLFAEGAPT